MVGVGWCWLDRLVDWLVDWLVDLSPLPPPWFLSFAVAFAVDIGIVNSDDCFFSFHLLIQETIFAMPVEITERAMAHCGKTEVMGILILILSHP